MTDKELNAAIEKVLLPEYESMIPESEEHLFSEEFESNMRSLISGRKKSRKKLPGREVQNRPEPVRVRKSHWRTTAAAAVLLVVIAAVLFITASNSDNIETADRPETVPQSSAIEQPTRNSEPDHDEGTKHIDMLDIIAADIQDFPDKHSVKYYSDSHNADSGEHWNYCYYQNTFENTHFKDAESFIMFLRITYDHTYYLGSVKYKEKTGTGSVTADKPSYDPEAYEDPVDKDIKEIFNGTLPMITLSPTDYLRTHWFGVLRSVRYVVRNGTGYLLVETSDEYNRTAEQSYFRVMGYDNSPDGIDMPMMSDGKLTLKDWDYCTTSYTRSMSRDEFVSLDGKQKISISDKENTAGFTFSIDNSRDAPSVAISDIRTADDDKILSMYFEIYLQDENGVQKQPVVEGELKEGSYLVASPYNDKIKGIKLIVRLNTDDHHEVTDRRNGTTQSAYTFDVSCLVNEDN